MTPDDLSDAEYEVEIAHAGRIALIGRFGPDRTELAEFPMWKKVVVRVIPVRHRWRLSWAAPLVMEQFAEMQRH